MRERRTKARALCIINEPARIFQRENELSGAFCFKNALDGMKNNAINSKEE